MHFQTTFVLEGRCLGNAFAENFLKRFMSTCHVMSTKSHKSITFYCLCGFPFASAIPTHSKQLSSGKGSDPPSDESLADRQCVKAHSLC